MTLHEEHGVGPEPGTCSKCGGYFEEMCHYRTGCKYEQDKVIAEEKIVEFLEGVPCQDYQETGSRVICNPPVMDTDEDFIFDCSAKGQMAEAENFLRGHGFYVVDIAEDDYDDIRENFTSYRFGNLNFILCNNERFYQKFTFATAVATELNLLKKEDRVTLFQAILYGKINGEEYP